MQLSFESIRFLATEILSHMNIKGLSVIVCRAAQGTPLHVGIKSPFTMTRKSYASVAGEV